MTEPSHSVTFLESVLKAATTVASNFFETGCILSVVVCCFAKQWFGLYIYVPEKSNFPVL